MLFSILHIISLPIIQTAKIGSLVDVSESEDPEGLRVFYYLVQDLRVSVILFYRKSCFLLVITKHAC